MAKYVNIFDEDSDREEDEIIMVFEPEEDGYITVSMENADGECSFSLSPDERRKLIAALQKGL